MNEEPKQDLTGFGTVQKLTRLLAAPVIEPSQRAARIQTVEKDIVLPLRVLLVAILGSYFFFSGWLNTPGAAPTPAPVVHNEKAQRVHDQLLQIAANEKDWTLQNAMALKGAWVAYAVLTLAAGAIFLWGKRLSLAKIQWMVFALGAVDAAMMGTLTLVSGGFDTSSLLGLFRADPAQRPGHSGGLPATAAQFFRQHDLHDRGHPGPAADPRPGSGRRIPWERMIVLLAWAMCCYGIQVLFEKQKRAEAEATELAVRQERLRTAGRLAAEIAHQIKNPLGIITNAAFCLHRATQEGQTAVDEQIQIIREEVERADQIVTELMGYAQLAEGKVERLEVAEELDAALQEVFPPAAQVPGQNPQGLRPGPAGFVDATAPSFRRAGQPPAKRPRSHERPGRHPRFGPVRRA